MLKFLVAAALVMLAVPATPARADEAALGPVKKPALFNEVYIPGGFDDNDVVQIVGEGLFRNSCYRPGPTAAKVDQKNFTVTLNPAAYEYPGICLQVILPFERTVDVGILHDGTYKVIQNEEQIATFKVAKARTLSPDDYLYAPISQAYFRQEGTVSKVLLSGDFPTDCMALDHVVTRVENKVLVIQPIAKMEERGDCKQGKFPFNTVATIDLVPQGRYLLHVRSMNAKAVNNLVDIKY
jgi:hypothetical protein